MATFSTETFRLPKVSIVIASYNSESQSYLRRCLDSIRNQDYRGEIELIVVDGGSSDASVPLSMSFGAKIINNPEITELGFNGGKNLGFKNSTGELIAMVDADNILMGPDYLTRMTEPFLEDKEISMTLPMPYVPSPTECTSICRYFCFMERKLFESVMVHGSYGDRWVKIKPSKVVVSNGAIIRRSVLERIGGFDYDTEVGFRMINSGFGYFAIVTSAERFHLEMMRFRDVWKKYKRRVINQVQEADNKKVSQFDIDNKKKHPLMFFSEEFLNPFKIVSNENKKYIPITFSLFLLKNILGIYYICYSHKYRKRQMKELYPA